MPRSPLWFRALFVSLSLALCAGCPATSLIGQPCADPGESPCEGDKLLRCDGSYYVELAPCAAECVAGKDPVAHTAGSITADETWECAAGPHLVQGILNVTAGATLTIQAGSLVRLDPASRINADPGSRVDSLGDPNARILLTSNNQQESGFGAGAEGGINVPATDEGEPSRILHTIIERGIHGLGVINLEDGLAAPVVENSVFRDNTNWGIRLTCNGTDVELPDFTATNEFFSNGDEAEPGEGGDISPCNP